MPLTIYLFFFVTFHLSTSRIGSRVGFKIQGFCYQNSYYHFFYYIPFIEISYRSGIQNPGPLLSEQILSFYLFPSIYQNLIQIIEWDSKPKAFAIRTVIIIFFITFHLLKCHIDSRVGLKTQSLCYRSSYYHFFHYLPFIEISYRQQSGIQNPGPLLSKQMLLLTWLLDHQLNIISNSVYQKNVRNQLKESFIKNQ